MKQITILLDIVTFISGNVECWIKYYDIVFIIRAWLEIEHI